MNDVLEIRGFEPTDLPFISSTWGFGLRYGNDLFQLIDEESYMDHYPHQIIPKIVERSEVEVACLKEDPNVIVGYAVKSKKILHFVYIKEAWRKMGIAKKLIGEMDHFTHFTRLGLKIQKEKYPRALYNPFLI